MSWVQKKRLLCILAYSPFGKPPLSSRCVLGFETSFKMTLWDLFPGHRQELWVQGKAADLSISWSTCMPKHFPVTPLKMQWDRQWDFNQCRQKMAAYKHSMWLCSRSFHRSSASRCRKWSLWIVTATVKLRFTPWWLNFAISLREHVCRTVGQPRARHGSTTFRSALNIVRSGTKRKKGEGENTAEIAPDSGDSLQK